MHCTDCGNWIDKCTCFQKYANERDFFTGGNVTHSRCNHFDTAGDRGQRFEVTYFDPRDSKRKVLGWASTQEGAQQMADGIEKHPSWEYPQIKDRSSSHTE